MTRAIPTIATLRLTLRAFGPEDGNAMHALLSGQDVLRYFPRTDPPPLDRLAAMIRGILAHWGEHGYGLWAVTATDTARLMGRCGIQLIPDTGETEVDFLLGRPYWGRGYATEAARASLEFACERTGVTRIVGIVHPENAASKRVLEKIGLTFDARANYFGMDCERYQIDRRSLERLYARRPGERRPAHPR